MLRTLAFDYLYYLSCSYRLDNQNFNLYMHGLKAIRETIREKIEENNKS